jgi:NTE family protein
MGKVLQLERGAAGDGSRRRRRRRSKTALVLGGGGLTGGVYQVGALRAIDLLSVNRTINDFDVFVGTSAGSFVAAMAASGITAEEMMRVLDRRVPTPFRELDLGTLLRPNVAEFARRGVRLPMHLARMAHALAGQWPAVSAMDLVLGLAEALPSGLYSGRGIEEYVRDVLSDPQRSDDFRTLRPELYLAATDLDTCERIVFGADDWDDVPISTAVAASTAMPLLYRPVRVRDRAFVDGGVVSTTNLDIAVQAGAKLVVVVNPLVPYVNDLSKSMSTPAGRRPRRVSDMGVPQIGYQTFKLLAYQRLHEMARHWESRYPGVDIVLVEPQPDDALMFQTSIMNYAKRVEIARHGFESVTAKLVEDYDRLEAICERHGVEISATRVRNVVGHFATTQERTRAWRKILEQTTGTLLRQSAGD